MLTQPQHQQQKSDLNEHKTQLQRQQTQVMPASNLIPNSLFAMKMNENDSSWMQHIPPPPPLFLISLNAQPPQEKY